ncbi:MAG: GDSL-type esterase/lipase family protein [Rhodobacteraceae bacterium]|nr:GDSL-type esterase/lipase family protein [Paracoccaceae bacterium]
MTRRLLCYGDSNTHGTPPMTFLNQWERFDHETRWTGHLRNSLGPDWEIIEEGLPGRTTLHDDPIEGVHMNGLSHLPVSLNSHRPLDLVCIMLGTNDLKARFLVPALEILISLRLLAQTAISSGTGPDQSSPKVLIVLPPPIQEVGIFSDVYHGGNKRSLHMKELAPGFFKENYLIWMDAGEHMEVSPIDGIHFDKVGHQKLGLAVAKTILEKF